MTKFYELPKRSLIKLSEEDGRVFRFYDIDNGEALCKYNGSYLKFKATDEVLSVGRFNEAKDAQL